MQHNSTRKQQHKYHDASLCFFAVTSKCPHVSLYNALLTSGVTYLRYDYILLGFPSFLRRWLIVLTLCLCFIFLLRCLCWFDRLPVLRLTLLQLRCRLVPFLYRILIREPVCLLVHEALLPDLQKVLQVSAILLTVLIWQKYFLLLHELSISFRYRYPPQRVCRSGPAAVCKNSEIWVRHQPVSWTQLQQSHRKQTFSVIRSVYLTTPGQCHLHQLLPRDIHNDYLQQWHLQYSFSMANSTYSTANNGSI